MKKYIYLGLLGLSALSLSACSSKESAPSEIYSEVVEDDESEVYGNITATLMKAFNARYSLNDSVVSEADKLFTESGHFEDTYEIWKSIVNESIDTVSQTNLYLDEYIKDVESYHNEVKEFGLSHGLIYTNGKKTGLKVSMEEISPLVEGQSVIEETSAEIQETEGTDNEYIEESLEQTTEYVMSDEEYKAYLDEVFSDTPNYVVYTVDGLESELNTFEDKDLLGQYLIDNYRNFNGGDWGDYEPTFYDLLESYVCYSGYDDDLNGIIDMETWDAFTIEEAREHVKKILIFNYDSFNNYLLEEYELMNSDEYKQRFIDSRRNSKEEVERLKAEYGIVDETDSTTSSYVSDEYEIWCKSNEDYINYIDNHDFENPVFSDVIKKDEVGYYIPWSEIYALADNEGRLTDYLEFIAYGETIKVEMPEAPRSYYSDKLMILQTSDIVVNHTGVKSIELTLRMPDKDGVQTLTINLTEDNKLVYNSSITSIIFN